MSGNVPIGPLAKVPHLVVALEIVDQQGQPVSKQFQLLPGPNVFRCRATFVDGSSSFFKPYWTCPLILRNGGLDLFGVLGSQRRDSVAIHASVRQERYTELAAWVFQPRDDQRNEFPVAGIAFDYSAIDQLVEGE